MIDQECNSPGAGRGGSLTARRGCPGAHLGDVATVSAPRKAHLGPFPPSYPRQASQTWKALSCSAPLPPSAWTSRCLCPGSAAGTRAVSWPHRSSQTDSNGTETLPQAEVKEEGKLENFSFLSEGKQSQPALRSVGLSQTFPRRVACGAPCGSRLHPA